LASFFIVSVLALFPSSTLLGQLIDLMLLIFLLLPIYGFINNNLVKKFYNLKVKDKWVTSLFSGVVIIVITLTYGNFLEKILSIINLEVVYLTANLIVSPFIIGLTGFTASYIISSKVRDEMSDTKWVKYE
jgi:hypothetical protein